MWKLNNEYQVKASYRIAALEILHHNEGITIAWGSVIENIKFSAKES